MVRAAIFYGPGEVRLGEIPEAQLEPGDIRIRVALCGVCGSDIKTFVRGTPYITPPAVLGHEVVGSVVESQSNKWAVGDRVAVAHYVPCGACEFCLSGHGTLCPTLFSRRIDPGCFAEYVRVPRDLAERGTFRLADGTPWDQAALSEPLAACIHALRKIQLPPGGSVLVMGDGPMGLLLVQAARVFGATTVMLSGVTPHRMQMGRRYADRVFDATRDDLEKVLTDDRPDAVFVAVDATEPAQQSLRIVKPGGTVVLFAGYAKNTVLSLDPNIIHYGEVRVIGSVGSLPEDFALALRLLESGKVDGAGLITARYGLGDVAEALVRGTRREGVKAVVEVDR